MTTTGPAPRHRAAVIGSPVAHSLSPVLHRAAYADLGLEGWEYALSSLPEPWGDIPVGFLWPGMRKPPDTS